MPLLCRLGRSTAAGTRRKCRFPAACPNRGYAACRGPMQRRYVPEFRVEERRSQWAMVVSIGHSAAFGRNRTTSSKSLRTWLRSPTRPRSPGSPRRSCSICDRSMSPSPFPSASCEPGLSRGDQRKPRDCGAEPNPASPTALEVFSATEFRRLDSGRIRHLPSTATRLARVDGCWALAGKKAQRARTPHSPVEQRFEPVRHSY